MRHICEQYRDYEKALSALREALKHMVKARAANKEERCKQLQQKIYLVDRFVEARKVTTPLIGIELEMNWNCIGIKSK